MVKQCSTFGISIMIFLTSMDSHFHLYFFPALEYPPHYHPRGRLPENSIKLYGPIYFLQYSQIVLFDYFHLESVDV